MPEQHHHLANNCENIANLQGAEAYCVAMLTACYVFIKPIAVGSPFIDRSLQIPRVNALQR